jgi:phosphatidylinositol-3-phosphatase
VLSKYVAPGTTTATPYNHYSLLRTIENLLGVPPLGYAARSTPFGADVFNAPAPAAHKRSRHHTRKRHPKRSRHH